ncbi:hypothetical protein [Pseudomonas veronii]|uniref:YcaO domain-containing protein n=1 Tax=Pseudomonas veronii TaxID=76761 RepID=A0A6G8ITN6_PSEVE|nr:hypothetical protein [Pseudomonas veronii]QIM56522.1 hypothetical protein E4167_35775 [Pseudomonas veronii]
MFDISDARFPGVCILVVYGQSKENHHVNYCAGMSYSATLSDALEKSILELWQTYRFMDLFKSVDSDEKRIEDYYLRYFLEWAAAKLSATPDLSGTVLPLCPIPNSASKSAPSFNSVKLKASACAALLA